MGYVMNMNLIILAAGKSERLSKITQLKKPLFVVNGMPVLWWCLKSFNDLITSGILQKTDIYVVVLREDLDLFLECEPLREFFCDHNPYIVIDSKIRESEFFDFSSKVIISDCDHHFNSFVISRDIRNYDSSIMIWQSPKDKEDLSWSFYLDDGVNKRIIEKPLTANGIDASKGIVGVYLFTNLHLLDFLLVNIFLNIAEYGDRELFISDLINFAIKCEFKIHSGIIHNFYALGNPKQIEKSSTMLNKDSIFDANTYLIDVDGTVINHDAGYHVRGNFNEATLLENSKKSINELYSHGNKIILLTARPSTSINALETSLKDFGLLYDQIIPNLTGGQRILINDLKPNKESIPTSISVNLIRNNGIDLGSVSKQKLLLDKNISGGSGAETVILRFGEERFVRKSYLKKGKNDSRLEYQKAWYGFVYQLMEEKTVPKILYSNNLNALGGIDYFDSEFIPGLQSFHSALDGLNNNYLINNLITTLGKVYEKTESKSKSGDNEIIHEILFKKVIPSIEDIKSKFAIKDELVIEYLDYKSKPLKVISDTIDRLLTNISAKNNFFRKGVKCLIHGDPTFENIMIEESLKNIYLMDPVGSLIDPSFTFKNKLGTSYPVFDLARLELSFKFNYEKIKVQHFDYTFEKDSLGSIVSIKFNHKLDQHLISESILTVDSVRNLYSNYDLEVLNIIVFTTILRILKYKTSLHEVLVLLNLAAKIGTEF
jgi:choline kinase